MDIIVPTGAMGNIAGAYMAKQLLGLKLSKIVCGVNINDATHTVMSQGKLCTEGAMKKTLSEAINVQMVRIMLQPSLSLSLESQYLTFVFRWIYH